MRWIWLLAAVTSLVAQPVDPREIVRKSVQLDQANWLRMKDYAWIRREKERRFDSRGAVKSEEAHGWDVVVLGGEQTWRLVERDGKPLPPDEDRKERAKYDAKAEKLERESPPSGSGASPKPTRAAARSSSFCLRFPICTTRGWSLMP